MKNFQDFIGEKMIAKGKLGALRGRLARIKGNTPADQGKRAAIEDDIKRMKKKLGFKVEEKKNSLFERPEDEMDKALRDVYSIFRSTKFEDLKKFAKGKDEKEIMYLYDAWEHTIKDDQRSMSGHTILSRSIKKNKKITIGVLRAFLNTAKK